MGERGSGFGPTQMGKWCALMWVQACTVIRALVYELWFKEVRPVVVGTRLGVKS